MEQRYVRNAIVRENYWKVENFFETKADGYVAASQEYKTPRGTMLVVFKDRQAGFLLDSDTGLPITNEELTSELASLVKEGSINESFDDIYPDAWVLIGVKGIITDDEWLNEFGFTADQIQDVEERMTDLENYFEDTEEEM